MKQSNLIEEFRSSLGKAIEKLNEDGKKAQIIIFVDEIDRCRPVYAVELLERIKHLFNIENVIFVISLDKQQLHNSLGALYGQGINSDEYLRRFIDLEYMLPKPDAKAFTNNLFNRFEFDKLLEKGSYEKLELIKTFTELSDAFTLSLRAREQCFTKIRVAMMVKNNYSYPCILIVLVLLKIVAPEIYRRYVFLDGTAKDVIEYLEKKVNINTFCNINLEVSLIVAKEKSCQEESEEIRQYKILAESHKAEQKEIEQAKEIIKLYKERYSIEPSLSDIVNKIELAAQFK